METETRVVIVEDVRIGLNMHIILSWWTVSSTFSLSIQNGGGEGEGGKEEVEEEGWKDIGVQKN